MTKSREKACAANSPQLKRIAQVLGRQSAGELLRHDNPATPPTDPNDSSLTKYVRAAEIARHFNVDVRTVRRWIKDEMLPSVRVGGARLVAVADLVRLVSPPLNQDDISTDEITED